VEVLLDDNAERRLFLKQKTNHELFELYYDHLKVKLAPGQFDQYKQLLDKFHQFLGEFPPSVELATKFLARYVNHAQATIVRYTGMMRGFMGWCGEDLDIKPRKPKSLPQYVDPKDIEKLIGFIENKRTHKGTIRRDIMLIKFAINTGLRRGELARLIVRDIHINEKVVFVRHGKGDKDRTVPLLSKFVKELAEYIKDMYPTESVFKLTGESIADKVYTWSKKAGVNLHTHSFRHYFAEQLLDRGVPLTVVSALLGHEDLQATAVYLGLRPESLREAVEKLGGPPTEEEDKLLKSQDEIDHNISDLESSRYHSEKRDLPQELHTGHEPYTETRHKQKMRELAGDLRLEVGLPPELEIFLKRRFNTIALSIDQEENHLSQGLRNHLKSGGFQDVLKEIQDWKTEAEKYLVKCQDLFESVKDKIPNDEVIALFNGEPKEGLILEPFCGTGCADIVAKITGFPTRLGYTTERRFLNLDLWVLKYGAYDIYLAHNREELDNHQKTHEDIIAACVSDPVNVDFASIKNNLSELDT